MKNQKFNSNLCPNCKSLSYISIDEEKIYIFKYNYA